MTSPRLGVLARQTLRSTYHSTASPLLIVRGARPSFALGWAVVSEVSAHCKRFVRALGPLAPRKHSRPPNTFTSPLGYAFAARLPISCLCNDLKRRGTMFALWIHSGLHALIVPNAPWSLPTPSSSCDRFAAARLRLQRHRIPQPVECLCPTLSCAPLSHDPLARPKCFAPVRLPSRKTPYLSVVSRRSFVTLQNRDWYLISYPPLL